MNVPFFQETTDTRPEQWLGTGSRSTSECDEGDDKMSGNRRT
eukprot:CAMPEP_0198335434 /NCGR_PEP_ID=MMETSP1450-20131203/20312_1 /TAXON_ID=753684 ORGANISM="Madagascaria erythrocladiodes, Strain CCMP3234" /NCGR_SAMPLE_ID=MMETSP1450 /ASSEMBLY_ACC=CAM_ASM_001115 /LENGTH=41 /DNA_ID= /DNA_START= /DNA_END= /DNA_ORIENTATION=